MRGRRAFVILTFYLLLMCAFVAILYAGFALGGNNRSTETAVAGKTIFTAILSIQAFLAVFLSPAFTAASITGEKERQTYDLLRTTLLSARALVTGKLISALSYILLLILAAIPMESIAFFLGGVSFVELFVSQLLMIVSAITFGLLGLFGCLAPIARKCRSVGSECWLQRRWARRIWPELPCAYRLLA